MTTAEPPQAGETAEPEPGGGVDGAESAQGQLEREVGRELARRLISALSGGHGRCGSSSP